MRACPGIAVTHLLDGFSLEIELIRPCHSLQVMDIFVKTMALFLHGYSQSLDVHCYNTFTRFT